MGIFKKTKRETLPAKGMMFDPYAPAIWYGMPIKSSIKRYMNEKEAEDWMRKTGNPVFFCW